jgi:dipeptidyl aminopeptidase/acylaminoacyl peptidase
MAEPIPTDAYYELRLLTDVAVSPAGDRVAFVADEFDGDEDERRSALFVVPTDGSREPHRLSRASDASAPVWSSGGDRLAFLAARESDATLGLGPPDDEDDEPADEEGDASDESLATGGEGPRTQAWVFDLALGGDARQVTTDEAFPEGVRDLDWGSGGDRLVVAARDPTDDQAEYLRERREDDGPIVTERLQHKFDGTGWLDEVTAYLFVVDVATREATRLDDAYGSGAFEAAAGLQPAWGDDRIAFLSYRGADGEDPDDSAAMDLYTIAPDGGGLRRLTGGDVTASVPEWSPGGDRLAFGAADPDNWCVPTEVHTVRDDPAATPRSLTPDLDRTLDRSGVVRWADDGTVIGQFASEAHTRLARLDAGDEADPEWLADLGPDREFDRFDLRGGTVAFALDHPSEGTDVAVASLSALDDERVEPTRLSSLNDDLLAEHPTPTARRVRFESDGHGLDAIAYLPAGVDADDGPDEPLPLVVSIHGGPVSYDAPTFSFEYAALCSRGYAVVCPNYRGGASYGRAFAETLHGRWGTVEVDDVVACVESLVDRGWADPDRVFGRGFSYGGIAQGHIVARTDLFAAAAPEHGIYDLRSEFGTSDSHLPTEREFGLPWEKPVTYDAGSSITDVGNVDTPLLITAGGEDWRCPPSQSEQLYVAVKKQGVDAKLVVYPEEHHDVGDPDRAIHRLDELIDWYATHDPARTDGDDGDGT